MIGASGGLDIIPAVVQVLINHFVLAMEPLAAVQTARIYHRVLWSFYLYIGYLKVLITRKLFCLQKCAANSKRCTV